MHSLQENGCSKVSCRWNKRREMHSAVQCSPACECICSLSGACELRRQTHSLLPLVCSLSSAIPAHFSLPLLLHAPPSIAIPATETDLT